MSSTLKIMAARYSDSRDLTRQYLERTTAPLDGMWESFAISGKHFSFDQHGTSVGFCVVNEQNKLLRFMVSDDLDSRMVFEQTVSELKVKGAFVATCDPQFLSLCLDLQKRVMVNAIMYRLGQFEHCIKPAFANESVFGLVDIKKLDEAVAFAADAIGAERKWLTDYYAQRISGNELYGLWDKRRLIAVGEYRPSHSQPPYADVGMIVALDQRGKSIGTNILRALNAICEQQEKMAICSTEADNLAAQLAIKRAGFIACDRLLEIEF